MRLNSRFVFSLVALALLRVEPKLKAETARVEQQVAGLKLEMTNAWQGVLKIVNQPVRAYVRAADTSASVSSPGWFHEGATKPDFNTVDIRQTQELDYAKNKFVTSDLNPGLVFLGQDLEFNSMTKLFYTNRALPKHKLSEADMLEVNRLYRIIGRCETELNQLLHPARADLAAEPGKTSAAATSAETETETVVPGQSFENIRSIPRQTRILYGGIAIGGLLLIMIILRLIKRKAG